MAISLKNLITEIYQYTPPKINIFHATRDGSFPADKKAARQLFYDFYAMTTLHIIFHHSKPSENNPEIIEMPISGVVLPKKMEEIIEITYEQVIRTLANKLSEYLRLSLIQELRHMMSQSNGWVAFRQALVSLYNKTHKLTSEDFNTLVQKHLPKMHNNVDSVMRLLKFSKYYSGIQTDDDKEIYDLASKSVHVPGEPLNKEEEPLVAPSQEEPATTEPSEPDDTDYNAPQIEDPFADEPASSIPSLKDPTYTSSKWYYNPSGKEDAKYGQLKHEAEKEKIAADKKKNKNEGLLNEYLTGKLDASAIKRIRASINKSGLKWDDVDNALNKINWDGSYGGPKWGTGSNALIKLLPVVNKMKPGMDYTTLAQIVDHIFDLEHNGGALLNKGAMFIDSTDLDRRAKITNVARFIPYVSPSIKNIIVVFLRYMPNGGNPEIHKEIQKYTNVPTQAFKPEEAAKLQELGFNMEQVGIYKAKVITYGKKKDSSGKPILIPNQYYTVKFHTNGKYTIEDTLKADIEVYDNFNDLLKHIDRFKKEIAGVSGSAPASQQSQLQKYLSSNIRIKLPPDKATILLDTCKMGWRSAAGSQYYKAYFDDGRRFKLYVFDNGTFLTCWKSDDNKIDVYTNWELALNACVNATKDASDYPDIENAKAQIGNVVPTPPSPVPVPPTATQPLDAYPSPPPIKGKIGTGQELTAQTPTIYNDVTNLPPNSPSAALYNAHAGINSLPKNSIRLTKEDDEKLKTCGFEPKVLNKNVAYIHINTKDSVFFYPNNTSKLYFHNVSSSSPVINMSIISMINWIIEHYSPNTSVSPINAPKSKAINPSMKGGTKLGTIVEKQLSNAGFKWDNTNEIYINTSTFDNIIIKPYPKSTVTMANGEQFTFNTLPGLLEFLKTNYLQKKSNVTAPLAVTKTKEPASEEISQIIEFIKGYGFSPKIINGQPFNGLYIHPTTDSVVKILGSNGNKIISCDGVHFNPYNPSDLLDFYKVIKDKFTPSQSPTNKLIDSNILREVTEFLYNHGFFLAKTATHLKNFGHSIDTKAQVVIGDNGLIRFAHVLNDYNKVYNEKTINEFYKFIGEHYDVVSPSEKNKNEDFSYPSELINEVSNTVKKYGFQIVQFGYPTDEILITFVSPGNNLEITINNKDIISVFYLSGSELADTYDGNDPAAFVTFKEFLSDSFAEGLADKFAHEKLVNNVGNLLESYGFEYVKNSDTTPLLYSHFSGETNVYINISEGTLQVIDKNKNEVLYDLNNALHLHLLQQYLEENYSTSKKQKDDENKAPVTTETGEEISLENKLPEALALGGYAGSPQNATEKKRGELYKNTSGDSIVILDNNDPNKNINKAYVKYKDETIKFKNITELVKWIYKTYNNSQSDALETLLKKYGYISKPVAGSTFAAIWENEKDGNTLYINTDGSSANIPDGLSFSNVKFNNQIELIKYLNTKHGALNSPEDNSASDDLIDTAIAAGFKWIPSSNNKKFKGVYKHPDGCTIHIYPTQGTSGGAKLLDKNETTLMYSPSYVDLKIYVEEKYNVKKSSFSALELLTGDVELDQMLKDAGFELDTDMVGAQVIGLINKEKKITIHVYNDESSAIKNGPTDEFTFSDYKSLKEYLHNVYIVNPTSGFPGVPELEESWQKLWNKLQDYNFKLVGPIIGTPKGKTYKHPNGMVIKVWVNGKSEYYGSTNSLICSYNTFDTMGKYLDQIYNPEEKYPTEYYNELGDYQQAYTIRLKKEDEKKLKLLGWIFVSAAESQVISAYVHKETYSRIAFFNKSLSSNKQSPFAILVSPNGVTVLKFDAEKWKIPSIITYLQEHPQTSSENEPIGGKYSKVYYVDIGPSDQSGGIRLIKEHEEILKELGFEWSPAYNLKNPPWYVNTVDGSFLYFNNLKVTHFHDDGVQYIDTQGSIKHKWKTIHEALDWAVKTFQPLKGGNYSLHYYDGVGPTPNSSYIRLKINDEKIMEEAGFKWVPGWISGKINSYSNVIYGKKIVLNNLNLYSKKSVADFMDVVSGTVIHSFRTIDETFDFISNYTPKSLKTKVETPQSVNKDNEEIEEDPFPSSGLHNSYELTPGLWALYLKDAGIFSHVTEKHGTYYIHPSSGTKFQVFQDGIIMKNDAGIRAWGIPESEHSTKLKKIIEEIGPTMNMNEVEKIFINGMKTRKEIAFETLYNQVKTLNGLASKDSVLSFDLDEHGFYWDKDNRVYVNNDLLQVVVLKPGISSDEYLFTLYYIDKKGVVQSATPSKKLLLSLIGPNGKICKYNSKPEDENPSSKKVPTSSGELYNNGTTEANKSLIKLGSYDENLLMTCGFKYVPQENKYYKNDNGDVAKFSDNGTAELHVANTFNVTEFNNVPDALKFISEHYYKKESGDVNVYPSVGIGTLAKAPSEIEEQLHTVGYGWSPAVAGYINTNGNKKIIFFNIDGTMRVVNPSANGFSTKVVSELIIFLKSDNKISTIDKILKEIQNIGFSCYANGNVGGIYIYQKSYQSSKLLQEIRLNVVDNSIILYLNTYNDNNEYIIVGTRHLNIQEGMDIFQNADLFNTTKIRLNSELENELFNNEYGFNGSKQTYSQINEPAGIVIELEFNMLDVAKASYIKKFESPVPEYEQLLGNHRDAIKWSKTSIFPDAKEKEISVVKPTPEEIASTMTKMGYKYKTILDSGDIVYSDTGTVDDKKQIHIQSKGKVIYYWFKDDTKWNSFVFLTWDEFLDYLSRHTKASPNTDVIPFIPNTPIANVQQSPNTSSINKPLSKSPKSSMPYSGFDYDKWSQSTGYDKYSTIQLVNKDRKMLKKLGFHFEYTGLANKPYNSNIYINNVGDIIIFHADGKSYYATHNQNVIYKTEHIKDMLEWLWDNFSNNQSGNRPVKENYYKTLMGTLYT